MLVNKGIDLSDQKDNISTGKKLKLILPNKKKKIREVSNDSNDSKGLKLKIKTNRKEKIFILTKKGDEGKNTIVPKKTEGANKITIKDRRLKS